MRNTVCEKWVFFRKMKNTPPNISRRFNAAKWRSPLGTIFVRISHLFIILIIHSSFLQFYMIAQIHLEIFFFLHFYIELPEMSFEKFAAPYNDRVGRYYRFKKNYLQINFTKLMAKQNVINGKTEKKLFKISK